jgi:hypothetical protein
VRLNFGDIPTWVAAVGTVGALFAALLQIRTERERRHDSERREADERHRSQARLVSAFPVAARDALSSLGPLSA